MELRFDTTRRGIYGRRSDFFDRTVYAQVANKTPSDSANASEEGDHAFQCSQPVTKASGLPAALGWRSCHLAIVLALDSWHVSGEHV
jgi:hypothetical protein